MRVSRFFSLQLTTGAKRVPPRANRLDECTMTTTTRRRTDWTVAQWADFGRRCREARDRLNHLIRSFPETAGLSTRHVNVMIRAHDRLVLAMLGAESVFASQHPDRNNEAIRTIHGGGHTIWAPCRGRVRRDVPPLSRGRWAELGREVKAIDREVGALGAEFLRTRGGGKSGYGTRFLRAREAMGRVKCRLDDLACGQHPGWPDVARVFYGPTEPRIEDPANP